jgi:hypothetical protein
MKLNLNFFFLLMIGFAVNAQVKSVSYDLRFNNETRLYDAYLIINEGNAHTPLERLQFNSLFSIVAPGNASFIMNKSHMPLVNNADYKGSKAMTWEVSSFLEKVPSLHGKSVYAITPKMNSSSFYNDLKEGDEVKLFSVEISPLPVDKSDVRIFNNQKDPSSKNLEGNNFNQGFTLGGIKQLFSEKEIEKIEQSGKTEISSVEVYPNPAIDHVNVKLQLNHITKVKLSMIDVTGKVIVNKIIEESQGAFIQQLGFNVIPGIYTIKIETDTEVTERKVSVLGQL